MTSGAHTPIGKCALVNVLTAASLRFRSVCEDDLHKINSTFNRTTRASRGELEKAVETLARIPTINKILPNFHPCVYKGFFHVYIASTKHSGSWENFQWSRILSFPPRD